MKYTAIVILILLASGCTSASGLKASESDGKICTLEKTTGSNIATRVCRTPEQIAYQEKISQEAMRDMTRGSVKIDK